MIVFPFSHKLLIKSFKMLLELLLIILLSSIPAVISYTLDYGLGHPMSNEPKTKELFSFYSLWLAKIRLKGEGKYSAILDFFHGEEEGEASQEIQDQINKTILLEAAKYFTWEKAFGMCPYCTNFWIAAYFSLLACFFVPLHFFAPALLPVLIPFFSHTFLRKL